MSANLQLAQDALREPAGQSDEAEHRSEEKIEQVVAGVDRGKPDCE
jgi:hypothetical protein